MPGPFDCGKLGPVQERPSHFGGLDGYPRSLSPCCSSSCSMSQVGSRSCPCSPRSPSRICSTHWSNDSRRAACRRRSPLAALFVVALAGFVFSVFVIPDLWEEVVVAAQGLMSHFTEDTARSGTEPRSGAMLPSSTGSSASASSGSCEIPPASSAFPLRVPPASSPPPLRRSTCCLSRSSSSTFWRVSAAGGARSRI